MVRCSAISQTTNFHQSHFSVRCNTISTLREIIITPSRIHIMIVELKFSMFCLIWSNSATLLGWYNSTKHNQKMGIPKTNVRLLRRFVKIVGKVFIILSYLVVWRNSLLVYFVTYIAYLSLYFRFVQKLCRIITNFFMISKMAVIL